MTRIILFVIIASFFLRKNACGFAYFYWHSFVYLTFEQINQKCGRIAKLFQTSTL